MFPSLSDIPAFKRFLLCCTLAVLAPLAVAQDEVSEDVLEAGIEDDEFFEFDEEEVEEEPAPTIADPLEGLNRATFTLNDKLYRGVLKPIARGLRVLPVGVRTSGSNFFTNLGAPVSAISALLQADLPNAGTELTRFAVNSTIGILGLFDPATGMGLIQDEEDMGQTFGRYGIGHGPYLVLPLLGSSSLRDAVGFGSNAAINPINADLDAGEVIALNLLNAEIALSLDEDTYEAFYDSALDPYVFFRSAWVQNRAGKVAK